MERVYFWIILAVTAFVTGLIFAFQGDVPWMVGAGLLLGFDIYMIERAVSELNKGDE